MKTYRALAASVFAVLACVTAAIAEEGKKDGGKEAVVVMPLIVSGLERDMVGNFENALIESLSATYKVYYGKKVQDTVEKVYKRRSEEAKAGKECDDTKCLQDIAMEFQTELIAVCNVKKMAGGFMLSLKIQNVIEDTVVLSKNIPCQNCDDFAAMRALQGIVAGRAVSPVAAQAALAPQAAAEESARVAAEEAAAERAATMVFVKQGEGGFYMDKTEVTQEAYQKVIGSNPSKFTGCPTCPVEQVNWDEADAYCKKGGKRLPTEQEWEYAATSGGKGETWAGTSNEDEIDDYVWHGAVFSSGNADGKTHPVGGKKPNGLGLYDMSGNVWEWTHSWYDDSKKSRVLRGGSWYSYASNLRVAYRFVPAPATRYNSVGFRCAQ